MSEHGLRDELRDRAWREIHNLRDNEMARRRELGLRPFKWSRLRVIVDDFTIHKFKYSMCIRYTPKDIDVLAEGYAGPPDLQNVELATEILDLLRKRQVLDDLASA